MTSGRLPQASPRCSGEDDLRGTSEEKLLFDIDLDAFAMKWEDFLFAWRPEVWDKRFIHEADYFASAGWSGKRFVQELLPRVGLITVAREPLGCGGEAEMQQIFRDFNGFVFDDQIEGVDI
jgi:hypothetical protein